MDPISSLTHNSRCRTKNSKYLINGIVSNLVKGFDEVQKDTITHLFLSNNSTPFATITFKPDADGEIITEDEPLMESYDLDHPENSVFYRKFNDYVYKYQNRKDITIDKLEISIDNLLIANMFNTLQTQLYVSQI